MIVGKDTVASPLWVGFEGKTLPPDLAVWLANGSVSGVVLFARNIDSPAQVRSLCREVRAAAGPGNPAPLIAVDQEGGRVARFRSPPYTEFPPALACSRFGRRSAEIAGAFGEAIGAELRVAGIDVDFAPVLDVVSNPGNPVIGDRSFSSDPDEAGRLGMAFAAGLMSRGILAVGKHFPGHGDTSTDSHRELPFVPAGKKTLMERELVPFRRAIREGIPALMTAHVVYPELDPSLPATLSGKILKGLLREKLRFRGTIVSDALEMKAISSLRGMGDAAVMAISAGCDVVLVCRGEEPQAAAIERIERESRDDATFRRCLTASALRSNRLRAWAASKERRRPNPRSVGSARHRELAALLWGRWADTGRTSQGDGSGNIGEG